MAKPNADKAANDYYEYKRRKEQQRLMREAQAGGPTARAAAPGQARPTAKAAKPAEAPAEALDQTPAPDQAADLIAPAASAQPAVDGAEPADLPEWEGAEAAPLNTAFDWDVEADGDDDEDDEPGALDRALEVAGRGALAAARAAQKGAGWLMNRSKEVLADYRERADERAERKREQRETQAAAEAETPEAAPDAPSAPGDDVYDYEYVPNRSLLGLVEPADAESADADSVQPLGSALSPGSAFSPDTQPPADAEAADLPDFAPRGNSPEWMRTLPDDEDDFEPREGRRGAAQRPSRFSSIFKRRAQAEPDDDMPSDAGSALQEGNGFMDKQNKPATSLTDLLAGDLGDTPVLSRRERRALAEAQKAQQEQPIDEPASPFAEEPVPAPARSPYADAPADLGSEWGAADGQVDEPTMEYTPLRARKQPEPRPEPARREPARRVKPAPVPRPPIELDDDDDEDDEPIVRHKGQRALSERAMQRPERLEPKRRVYEEELDDDFDDDDYDDDYDDDEMSVGKRILGFLKGLIVIGLILLLSV
ncbi:MAG: hypothetical protein GX558_11930, partial [Clostridiales bacterium]|nr:hypothetical protein [Clostridiales bacterium]